MDNDHNFVVTDNRDESVNRPAEWPRVYREYNTQLFYPKDTKAGGTWIGVDQKNLLICLMNGAFKRHQHKASYRKSRGIVVKELLASSNFLSDVDQYYFEGIEPFFALVFSWKNDIKIYELVWDGIEIHLHKKDETKSLIWSAAQTYTKEQHQKKEKKFMTFLKNDKSGGTTAKRIWTFHHSRGNKNEEGMIINRGRLKTTSVSQFQHRSNGRNYFRFHNLVTDIKGQEEEIIWQD